MSKDSILNLTTSTSAIWEGLKDDRDMPGFSVRATLPGDPDGVELMLEGWQAGMEEKAHSHPGDDMTIVVEGCMHLQFFTRSDSQLVADGDVLVLNKGDFGYIKANRIHSAKYIEDCKLVYVHDGVFDFNEEAA